MYYWLIRFAAAIVPRLPSRLLPPLSLLIGWIAWLSVPRLRRQAARNMLHVLGHETLKTRAGRRKLRRTVRGMFVNNVRNYLERFYLPRIPAATIAGNIQADGQEHLEAALARGKGVLLFSAHFGPFDYLSQWLAANGHEMIIPVEPLRDQRMLDLMLKLRCSHGINYLPLGNGSAMRAIMQALRKNQLVLITADRAVIGQSIEVPFFGAPAHLPAGPAMLAQRTGAALLGAFGWRVSGSRMAGEFVPVTLALPEEKQKDVDALQDGIVKAMERFIKEYPEQWVVFDPIWTDRATTTIEE